MSGVDGDKSWRLDGAPLKLITEKLQPKQHAIWHVSNDVCVHELFHRHFKAP